jgi:uncharacterized low-complexity protein
MVTKRQAPPPPGRFTGEVPRTPLKEKAREALRKRRSERLSRPKRPLIQVVQNTKGSRPAARRVRRRPRRRGALFALFSVVVAASVLTIAAVELASWTTASVIFASAEGVSAITAFAFGDPSPPKPARPKKPKTAGNPPRSGGHRCGAENKSKDGSCQRLVSKTGDHCWEHPGGGSGPNTKSQPARKTNGPRRTKKTAPPPATP